MKFMFFEPQKGFSWRMIIPVLVVAFFIVLIAVAIFNWRVTSQEYLGDLVAKDVEIVASMLERIDKDCKILSFDYQKNRINFLNVKSFVGSEVGSINLAYPNKWQGPYLDDNPTYQEKEYLVVRTNQGYFVTPGEGVILPNGKVIGKDIMLDENADIAAMAQDDQQLRFEGKALAVKLKLSTSTSDIITQLPLERI